MAVSIFIEFKRYKKVVEKTIEQLTHTQFNHVPFKDGNSIAMIVRHLTGNLKSRFTDFLTSDGEKPWRNREQEFADGPFKKDTLKAEWTEAWQILIHVLESMDEEDMKSSVRIRGIQLSVEEALNRSLAHIAYHAGQIVLLGRMYTGDEWEWISIPKGKSAEYNANPSLEKSPK